MSTWRHNTQHNDTQHSNTLHYNNQLKIINHNDTKPDGSKCDAQHNVMLSIAFYTVLLSVVLFYYYAKCRYAECRYARCRGTIGTVVINY